MATRLDLSYDAQVLAVRRRVLAYSARLWGSLPAFRDADAERLIAKLVPRVEAGQKRIAELTDAYLTRVAQVELGVNVRRGAVTSVTTQDLRGIAPEEVYRRPLVTTYTSLSTGNSLTDAVASGAARLEDIVSTGLQLAKTHSAQGQMRRTSGIAGYARVLTGRENCALCVIASTQRYHRGDLMPIHPACDCGIKQFKGNPQVQVIKPELLEQTHQIIDARLGGSDRSARDLGIGKTSSSGQPLSDFTDLIIAREHGEIGPVLTWRSDKFTSAADIEALAS
ncbi:hypothetical protein [Plantibacter sp. YIM 135249]|uniref:hypothetical protein n=1 Tax=Plantibacter sp. YIM 135249 TaxID=3423918 RepID=UPI003D326D77